MEQIHRQPGGSQEPADRTSHAELAAPDVGQSELQESWDERVIREGIEASISNDRLIDNRTARYIAGQLHGGQTSALYALASTGAIPPAAESELREERQVQPPIVQDWIDALTWYCQQREDRQPVSGWVEQAEAQDRIELVNRISGAGRPLGGIATVSYSGYVPTEAASDIDEVDNMSWADSARWRPGDDMAGAWIDGRLSSTQLDELFGGAPDEEAGSVDELGWFGLIRHEGRPGGYVLHASEQARHVWEAESDAALTRRWAEVQVEYEHFHAERDAFEQATEEVGTTPSGLAPRIWVGSLADYANGDLHGTWLDATREPAELELAARFMLRLGHTPGAEEWAIMDYDGFAGIELGEYESFETISRIAKGIAEHGEAFAHWAAYVGSESTEQVERFEDHCRGEWDSFEAYVRDYLEETEFYRFLEQVPEDMRGYVEVDVRQIARDWECDYHVAEGTNGRVWVFDPRE
jgi:antirestriction protein